MQDSFMGKLGDCRCLQTDERSDLRRAVILLNNYLEGALAFGDSPKSMKGTLLDDGEQGLVTAQDILNRIGATPTCRNGDRLPTECSCLSNMEREVINIGIKGLMKLDRNKKDLRRDYALANSIDRIKKSCSKP